MVAVGVLLNNDTVSVTLIVIGAGMFFIGALIPTLTEFQVGPTGFSAKLRERDLDFHTVLGPEADRLVRTATWLAGGAEAGRDLAERALIETYMRWPQERIDNPADAVRERMVEMAPPATAPPVTTEQHSQAGESGDLLSRLISLPVAERSALVLHLLDGLDTQAVAAITRSEPATVAADVARGAASIVGGGGAPPMEAAW
jgi:DNA-directed RNA polymerase specialized sigma24 family protein